MVVFLIIAICGASALARPLLTARTYPWLVSLRSSRALLVENFRELLKDSLGFAVAAVIHQDEAGLGGMIDEIDQAVAGLNRSVPDRNYYVD